ncbi:unnamed protein product [Hyaloperonospora brassicae]|uniref:RxLR effector candidate protein n=1 Tax=Hyaloperonospora brassicae TaxID=162125 RepID=A0AAV0UJP4_HYABA|nr:unnamed protein product [Hyaloperonospora brassicae]
MRLLVDFLLCTAACFAVVNALAPDPALGVSAQEDTSRRLISFAHEQEEDRSLTLQAILKNSRLTSRINEKAMAGTQLRQGVHISLPTVQPDDLDDLAWSTKLIASKAIAPLKEQATKQQIQLLQRYLDKGESPTVVFKLLALDKKADGILMNRELNTWLSYSTSFLREFPNETKKNVSLLDMLILHFESSGTSRILTASKGEKPNLASFLERELLERWHSKLKSPAYVYRMLGKQALHDYLRLIRSAEPSRR